VSIDFVFCFCDCISAQVSKEATTHIRLKAALNRGVSTSHLASATSVDFGCVCLVVNDDGMKLDESHAKAVGVSVLLEERYQESIMDCEWKHQSPGWQRSNATELLHTWCLPLVWSGMASSWVYSRNVEGNLLFVRPSNNLSVLVRYLHCTLYMKNSVLPIYWQGPEFETWPTFKMLNFIHKIWTKFQDKNVASTIADGFNTS